MVSGSTFRSLIYFEFIFMYYVGKHSSLFLLHFEQHFVVVQLISCVWLSVTPWSAAHQVSLSLSSLGACSSSCPLSQWCHPTVSSSVVSFFSSLQSFPASESFLMSRLFTPGGQSTGASASASVLPKYVQDWFPLGLTGLISLKSKGLSRVFPNVTVQKCQLFSLLYGPTLISIHDYWKNHSFDYIDHCWQGNVYSF